MPDSPDTIQLVSRYNTDSEVLSSITMGRDYDPGNANLLPGVGRLVLSAYTVPETVPEEPSENWFAGLTKREILTNAGGIALVGFADYQETKIAAAIGEDGTKQVNIPNTLTDDEAAQLLNEDLRRIRRKAWKGVPKLIALGFVADFIGIGGGTPPGVETVTVASLSMIGAVSISKDIARAQKAIKKHQVTFEGSQELDQVLSAYNSEGVNGALGVLDGLDGVADNNRFTPEWLNLAERLQVVEPSSSKNPFINLKSRVRKLGAIAKEVAIIRHIGRNTFDLEEDSKK